VWTGGLRGGRRTWSRCCRDFGWQVKKESKKANGHDRPSCVGIWRSSWTNRREGTEKDDGYRAKRPRNDGADRGGARDVPSDVHAIGTGGGGGDMDGARREGFAASTMVEATNARPTDRKWGYLPPPSHNAETLFWTRTKGQAWRNPNTRDKAPDESRRDASGGNVIPFPSQRRIPRDSQKPRPYFYIIPDADRRSRLWKRQYALVSSADARGNG
jgi:hypothetical protein